MSDPKIIVALDYANENEALEFISKVTPELCKLKVGKEMFTRLGPDFVRLLVNKNFDVFLDLKFHDIPNTVAKACVAAADLGVWMINLHASGGRKMMENTVEYLSDFGKDKPLLTAVTVLTSTDKADFVELGYTNSIEEQVLRLATLAKESGVDGVVCSSQEAACLKQSLGKEFVLVTPGIRPAGSSQDDQSRIMTPEQALANGSHYLVIGRPITQSADPLHSLIAINQSIQA